MRRWTLLGCWLVTVGGCSAGARPGALGEGWPGLPNATSEGGVATVQVAPGTVDAMSDRAMDVEAGPEAEAGGLCEGVVQKSPDVSEYETILSVPAPSGGAIAPGTYLLDEVTTYVTSDAGSPDAPPTWPTGALVRATIYVTATSMQFIGARGTDDGDGGVFPADTGYAERYAATGATLQFTRICPIAGAQSSMAYAARGNRLVLYQSPTAYEAFHLSL